MSRDHGGLAAHFFDHSVGGRGGGGHTDTIAGFTQTAYLPEFALSQQDAFSNIADAVIHRQVDFPSDPTFSERFRVVGADANRVRELFTADLRQFLQSIDPEWRMEASGHTLVLYQAGYKVKPQEFADFVDETTDIAKGFFDHCHLKKSAF
jgi:hypothetical protein